MDPNESFHNIIMILELIFMKFQVGMEKMAEKLRGFVMWGGRCTLYVDQRSTSVDFFANWILKSSKISLNFFRTKNLH